MLTIDKEQIFELKFGRHFEVSDSLTSMKVFYSTFEISRDTSNKVRLKRTSRSTTKVGSNI